MKRREFLKELGILGFIPGIIGLGLFVRRNEAKPVHHSPKGVIDKADWPKPQS